MQNKAIKANPLNADDKTRGYQINAMTSHIANLRSNVREKSSASVFVSSATIAQLSSKLDVRLAQQKRSSHKRSHSDTELVSPTPFSASFTS